MINRADYLANKNLHLEGFPPLTSLEKISVTFVKNQLPLAKMLWPNIKVGYPVDQIIILSNKLYIFLKNDTIKYLLPI